MTFSEALEELKKGSRIRQPYWKSDVFMQILPVDGFVNEMICFVTPVYSRPFYPLPGLQEFLANDWEVAP